jgi:BlaI family transcriptional regulator, penicillinase repressor
MPKRNLPMPTDAELAILKVLWERGSATVREVHEALGGERQTRYTTTLKQLQLMAEKGLVRRDETARSHVYEAAIEESDTLQRVAGDLVRRVFDGSARKLILHALGGRRTSPEELARIREMLDELERGK